MSEPVCPECGLTFDWADAVPIERLRCVHCDYHLYGLKDMRCPECGEDFTWPSVFAKYHRSRLAHFEYRWRDRPIRSFLGTWLWALRPTKVWKSFDLHDPPCVIPLVLTVVAQVLLIALGLGVLQGLDDWAWKRSWTLRSIAYGYTGSPVTIADIPSSILGGFQNLEVLEARLLTVFWAIASLCALLIYPQSMRKCRVRVAHVVRVWAYSTLTVVPVAIAGIFAISIIQAFSSANYWTWIDVAAMFGVLWFVTRSIGLAYRGYLRVPHARGIALASQAIAVLATVTYSLSTLGGGRGSIMGGILDVLGLV